MYGCSRAEVETLTGALRVPEDPDGVDQQRRRAHVAPHVDAEAPRRRRGPARPPRASMPASGPPFPARGAVAGDRHERVEEVVERAPDRLPGGRRRSPAPRARRPRARSPPRRGSADRRAPTRRTSPPSRSAPWRRGRVRRSPRRSRARGGAARSPIEPDDQCASTAARSGVAPSRASRAAIAAAVGPGNRKR